MFTKGETMKIYRRKFIATILIIMLLFIGNVAFATDINVLRAADVKAYDYPILPNTVGWKSLSTFKEKIDACQVSNSILEKMSTEDVIETALSYPLLPCIFVYGDNVEEGFNSVYKFCNPLQELTQREDATTLLVNRYLTSINNRYDNSFENIYIEVFLSHPIFQSKLSENDISILKSITKNDSSIHLNSFEIQRDYSYYVQTPNGTNVVAFYFDNDWTSAQKTAINNEMQTLFPNAIRERTATKFYNCHAYAWYSTSSTIHCWINNPSAYMTDGSYTKISSAAVNRKVYYDNNDDPDLTGNNHSGIITSVSGGVTTVTSKWGQAGLYKHNIYDSPYSGDRTSYTYWYR